jgi:hypothetical protein
MWAKHGAGISLVCNSTTPVLIIKGHACLVRRDGNTYGRETSLRSNLSPTWTATQWGGGNMTDTIPACIYLNILWMSLRFKMLNYLLSPGICVLNVGRSERRIVRFVCKSVYEEPLVSILNAVNSHFSQTTFRLRDVLCCVTSTMLRWSDMIGFCCRNVKLIYNV